MSDATRIHGSGYREAIGVALDVVGSRIGDRLGHVQFVCGVDPVFAGLHSYEEITDGRSYRQTAHCAYPFNLAGPRDRRVTTIIVPDARYRFRNPWALAHDFVHELGHALHEVIGFDCHPEPVTDYARTSRYEAFAEAFVSWLWPGDGYDRPDDATLALFRSL